jgi:predicted metal-dependent phosphoesterase TrpH
MGCLSSLDALPQSDELTPAALQLRDVLCGIEDDSCPHHYNFHMHTHCSDGKLSPTALMEQALTIGLRGLAITDHHTVRGYEQALSWLEDFHWRKGDRQTVPHLWSGIEINANLDGTEVHLLGLGFEPGHHAMRPYLQGRMSRGEDHEAAEVISAIKAAGGISLLAHPARYRRCATTLIELAAGLGIDGAETYYAYGNPSPWRPSSDQTLEVHAAIVRLGLLHSCGTDTHGDSLLRRL